MAKEMIAMLLAGGQGSRLYALTEKLAKPAVPFGGKYRIIDFPLSNCVNSGIDTVGILTQYQPMVLNEYIGNGQPCASRYSLRVFSDKKCFYWVLPWGSSASSKRVAARVSRLLDMMSVMAGASAAMLRNA